MRYTVLIDGEGGAYGVAFPDLPGCTAMGDTIDEALANAGEAVRDWMATFTADGSSPPAASAPEELRRDPAVVEALRAGASFGQVALVRATGRPVRPNLTLDEGVLAAIDAEAKRRKVTRSSMVEILARELLPALS